MEGSGYPSKLQDDHHQNVLLGASYGASQAALPVYDSVDEYSKENKRNDEKTNPFADLKVDLDHCDHNSFSKHQEAGVDELRREDKEETFVDHSSLYRKVEKKSKEQDQQNDLLQTKRKLMSQFMDDAEYDDAIPVYSEPSHDAVKSEFERQAEYENEYCAMLDVHRSSDIDVSLCESVYEEPISRKNIAEKEIQTKDIENSIANLQGNKGNEDGDGISNPAKEFKDEREYENVEHEEEVSLDEYPEDLKGYDTVPGTQGGSDVGTHRKDSYEYMSSINVQMLRYSGHGDESDPDNSYLVTCADVTRDDVIQGIDNPIYHEGDS